MHKFLAALLFCMPLYAVEGQFQIPLTETPSQERKVQLQLDIHTSDVKGVALDNQSIESEIANRLRLAQIEVTQSDSSIPALVLRVKSIEVTGECATFIQLAFFEETLLKRNQSTFMAITWSQATLVASDKKEYVHEIMNTIEGMVNSFILDYQKAFTKQSKGSNASTN